MVYKNSPFIRFIFGIDDVAGAMLGTAVIGGLTSIFGSKQAAGSSVESMQEYNAGQMELQKRQNAYNLQMYNLDNLYNSPAAQRQRYLSAGINPLMADMDGGLTQGPVTSADANLQPEGVQAADIKAQGYRQMVEQVLAGSQASLNYANAKKAESETNMNKFNYELAKDLRAGWIRKQGLEIEIGELGKELTRSQIRKLDLESDKTVTELQHLGPMLVETINKLRAEAYNSEQQGRLASAEADEVHEDALSRRAVNASQTALNYSEIGVNNSEIALNNSQRRLNDENAENVHQQTSFLKLTFNGRAHQLDLQNKELEGLVKQLSLNNDLTEQTFQMEIANRVYNCVLNMANGELAVSTAERTKQQNQMLNEANDFMNQYVVTKVLNEALVLLQNRLQGIVGGSVSTNIQGSQPAPVTVKGFGR